MAGTALVFEEINHSLGLTYCYAWRSGDAFGLVKTASWLVNSGTSPAPSNCSMACRICSRPTSARTPRTNSAEALDAYKRAEVDPGPGWRSSRSTRPCPIWPSQASRSWRRRWPSLAWRGPSIWSHRPSSTASVPARASRSKPRRAASGAPTSSTTLALAPGAEQTWHLVAEVSQDSADIVRLARRLRGDRPRRSPRSRLTSRPARPP